MSIILAPSSLFPVDEVENSDCDKFNQQLVELRCKTATAPTADAATTPGTSASNDATSEPALVVASSKTPASSDAGCVPDIVIDCTCLDTKPKPTKLYYCCCLNVRCSTSACRALLFVLAFGLLGGGVAASAVVGVWGMATDWTEARNYGLLSLAICLLVFIYICCVASHCQAGRKTRELQELAQTAQLQQQQQQQQPAAGLDRRIQPNRLSNNCLASSQLSLQYLQEEQQKQPLQQKKKPRPKATGAKVKKPGLAVAAGGKKSTAAAMTVGEERVLLPAPASGISLDKF